MFDGLKTREGKKRKQNKPALGFSVKDSFPAKLLLGFLLQPLHWEVGVRVPPKVNASQPLWLFTYYNVERFYGNVYDSLDVCMAAKLPHYPMPNMESAYFFYFGLLAKIYVSLKCKSVCEWETWLQLTSILSKKEKY